MSAASATPKEALFALFNGCVAVFDVLEQIESGEKAVPAVKRALRKAKRRARALRKADLERDGG